MFIGISAVIYSFLLGISMDYIFYFLIGVRD